jgi:hypothetical protein
MATPQDVLDGLVEALKQSPYPGGSFQTRDLDASGADNRLEQPVTVVKTLATPRLTQWDSDLEGVAIDENGNKLGLVYAAYWDIQVVIHVVVAVGNDNFDARDVGFELQQALMPFDGQNLQRPLPDGSGGDLDDVAPLTIGEGEPDDDLGGPGVRRWRQEISTSFEAQTVQTSSPTVSDIVVNDPDAAIVEDVDRA